MKAVLISIRPEWCEKIASGQKTIEIRKSRPKIEIPFKCYIYETQHANRKKWINLDNPYRRVAFARGRGKVIGEFICNGMLSHCESSNADLAEQQGCIRMEKIFDYSQGKELFGWHISDLVIYDQPKELCEFSRYWDYDNDTRPCDDCEHYIYDEINYALLCTEKHRGYPCPKMILTRPPQSWCYVEALT